jgi:predicted aspartyl protease
MRRTLLAAMFFFAMALCDSSAASELPDTRNETKAAITSGAADVVPDRQESFSTDAIYAFATRIDRIGRIIVPVMVNCRGPFQFLLDTGANATVLTPHLAQSLGLKIDPTQIMLMKGVTGAAPVPTVWVDRVEAGAIALAGRRIAVANATVIGTDGVLGVDGLEGKLVLVDFLHDRIQVLEAAAHRPGLNLAELPAKLQFGRLIMVDALVGTRKVKAVIDTGSQRTLGNRALYASIGLRPDMTIADAAAQVIGATDASQQGERYVVPLVTLSELTITNLTVTFGDFYIFRLWDLQSQPALVIGMDMIGTLDTFGVDYLRHEVQIRVARQRNPKRAEGRHWPTPSEPSTQMNCVNRIN